MRAKLLQVIQADLATGLPQGQDPLCVLFCAESNSNLCSMVTQLQFLTSLLTKLKDPSTSEGVIQNMASLRDTLTSPDNLRVIMSTNINTLTTPLTAWEGFLQQPLSKRSWEVFDSSAPSCLVFC